MLLGIFKVFPYKRCIEKSILLLFLEWNFPRFPAIHLAIGSPKDLFVIADHKENAR